MIVTVIPFFLLARFSEDVQTFSPELTFHMDIGLYVDGFENDTTIKTLNVANELICQVESSDTLKCTFRHINFTEINYDKASETVITENHNNESMQHIYEEIPFKIKYNKQGVKSVIMSEDATKDFRMDLIRSVANSLNLGINLREVNIEPTDVELKIQKRLNYLLGICKTTMDLVIIEKNGTDDEHNILFSGNGSDEKKYALDFAVSTEKLTDMELWVTKRSDNCRPEFNSFWSGIILNDLHNDPELNITSMQDVMRVNSEAFKSISDYQMKTKRNGDYLSIREESYLSLTDIYPAKKKIQDIREPVTIMIQQPEQKKLDRNSI